MKHVKKIASLMLALAIVFTMATTVFAAGTNTIKVTGAQAGETYNIYKMLDLSVDVEKDAYSYTVNDAWRNFFTGTGAGVEYVTIDDMGYVTWNESKKTAEDMEAFAKAAAAYATANSVAAAATAITPEADSDIIFEGLEPGYYLITSTNGTLAMIDTTPDKSDVTVNEKNPDPTIGKEVQEDSDSSWGAANSAQIGDTVNFKVTVNVKKGAKNYVIHDVMDEGLSFNVNSVAIEGLTKGTHYSVVTEGLTDGCTFEIRFDQTYLDDLNSAATLTVTYSAVLNEKVDLVNGEKNTVKLTWGNASETKVSTTITKTYQFEVLKHVSGDADKKPLAGATFQLKNAAGAVVKLIKVSDTEYRVANGEEANAVESFTTVSTGNIVIKGVDLDEYSLVETAAPAGYNLLKEPVKVNVDNTNEMVVEVANNAGTELPSTGGMGTTLFYVFGGIMVLAAVVLLVTKKRMSIAE